jgi:hypothetical protein
MANLKLLAKKLAVFATFEAENLDFTTLPPLAQNRLSAVRYSFLM